MGGDGAALHPPLFRPSTPTPSLRARRLSSSKKNEHRSFVKRRIMTACYVTQIPKVSSIPKHNFNTQFSADMYCGNRKMSHEHVNNIKKQFSSEGVFNYNVFFGAGTRVL